MSHSENLNKLNIDFNTKQTEQEKTFVESFNNIKDIVLSKITELDTKSLTTDDRILALE